MNIGIIGKGFVGNAIAESYKGHSVLWYDPFKPGSVDKIEDLFNELASIVGIRSRAIEGVNNAVNRFVADFQPEAWEQGEDLQQELYKLSNEVYGIVWQQSLEN